MGVGVGVGVGVDTGARARARAWALAVVLRVHGALGMGHWAWGIGHGALGMGHGAWGMGQWQCVCLLCDEVEEAGALGVGDAAVVANVQHEGLVCSTWVVSGV